MNKEKVLSILIENRGNIISGGYIGKTLGISRNGVWKIINLLKEEGYEIISTPNKGYSISKSLDILDKNTIINKLTTSKIGREIEILDSVDSTMDYMKNLDLASLKEGYTVLSNEQTKGRGRYNRVFYSPKGSSIYMSILLRPKFSMEEIHIITIIAGISVVKAVENIYKIKPNIKWINDIFYGGKKISGILTQGIMDIESGSIQNVILGIGINVFKMDIPNELKNIIGTIEEFRDISCDRNDLIKEVLNVFESLYLNLDINEIYEEYKGLLLYIGEDIIIKDIGGQKKGKFICLKKDFSITVKMEDGLIKNYKSGEISIINEEK